jgi:hypothetical protein
MTVVGLAFIRFGVGVGMYNNSLVAEYVYMEEQDVVQPYDAEKQQ